jgi:molybdenum cofactor cytidylyltransferase
MHDRSLQDTRCAAILLAAGASTRLGEPKQLVISDGETLLHRTARLAAEAACAPVIVVLGFAEASMRPALEGLDVTPVVNEDWAEGMGSSLRCGMEAMLQAHSSANAVLLLVCDQAKLTGEHLRCLLDLHGSGSAAITASRYGGRAGVPAVFSSQFFVNLLESHGDQGARELLRTHIGESSYVDFPAGVTDVDTPDDLKSLRTH